MTPTLSALAAATSDIPLKELDGTMLSLLIRNEAADAGWDGAAITAAIDLAAYAHRNQLRRNRGVMAITHYIEHPLRNAARLARYGATDVDLVIAAILHDVVEDGAAEIVTALYGPDFRSSDFRGSASAAIAEVFGARVGALVDAVTNPEVPGKLPHDAYRAHVEEAIVDPGVLLVKATDLIDNAGGLVYLLDMPGNAAMVAKLAAKYAPLLPVVATRAMADDVAALVNANGHRALLNHLAHVIVRLDVILGAEGN